MNVLDASAVLAVIQDEPGAAAVTAVLNGATMSTANLAEVAGKLIDAGIDGRLATRTLLAGGVQIEAVSIADAETAAALRESPGGRSLSLGDRCCLALALREPGANVLTADRVWAELDLPLTIQLIR